MGYDCKMVAIKKHVFDKWRNEYPDIPLSDLYGDLLFGFEEDYAKCYTIDGEPIPK